MHYGKNSDNLGDSKKALQCNPTTSRHESEAAASWSIRRKMGIWTIWYLDVEGGESPATEFEKAYEGGVE
jgi:hypothetical protein